MDFGPKVLDLAHHDEVRVCFQTMLTLETLLTSHSGIAFGFGLLAIFQGAYQYLMDAYGPYAASAVSPPPELLFSPARPVVSQAELTSQVGGGDIDAIRNLWSGHFGISDNVRKSRIGMGRLVRPVPSVSLSQNHGALEAEVGFADKAGV